APKATAPRAPSTPKAPISPALPEGTSLQVEVTRQYPMKAGEAIEGRLMHPIYSDGKLVISANTPLRGKVIALQPDKKTRWSGRVRGDFTPFDTAEVRFDELMLPSGPLPIAAATADRGAPVLRLSAPGATPRHSLIGREWAAAKTHLHDQIAFFTDPGRGERALQLLYHQLPYHPQRIAAHTAWSFELTAPVTLPDPPPNTVAEADSSQKSGAGKPETWAVHALLTRDLTSATARTGDPVQALVVEPVYDKDKQLVVPQGSTLLGKVSSAKAARSFGRNGKLRFTFQEVRFPEGFNRQVEGSLGGAATEKTQNLSMDAEGTITPRNQASAIAPLLLTMLAGRALDNDGNLTAQTGVASNGFGLVGRIVGVAAGSRNLAAGIGFYAAGLSVYDNFLHSGRDVVFPKDTRIEIETTPLRAPLLTPSGQ
ncbi:MAG TPA: hypothetical protein VFE01_01830, partial [Terracidiphilus sp.]|nr:hypothetical protein [Terracidiphilus sp.]